jgi:2-polyprenyl-3-methyl-5-hydroxy-6-metoxy-1,4-benzoquinol methylase
MPTDASNGWEAAASELIAIRSSVGEQVIKAWCQLLRPSADVLDLGCGAGLPVSGVLASAGFSLHAVDASPTLLATYRRRFPQAATACEDALTSKYFDSASGPSAGSRWEVLVYRAVADRRVARHYHAAALGLVG